MNFAALPNLIALAVLVAVFWAISRKSTSRQVRLWLFGWALVLAHFAATLFAPDRAIWSQLTTLVVLGSLILASIAFLISVSAIASTRARQAALAVAISVPTLAYTSGVIWSVESPLFYYLLIAAGVVAPLAVFLRYQEDSKFYAAGTVVATLLVAAIVATQVAKGEAGIGIVTILATLNFTAAVRYWKYHQRSTAGVLTSVGGFILWGAVFPAGALLQTFAPDVKIDSEVWNIPKYLVAVGMILTLLEDQIRKSSHLAYHDALTDLPNRRLLEDRLAQALAQAKRAGSKVAVFVLDLDHFKQVNDTFGHHVGDIALQQVAIRLASYIRACDTLARSGGDEFTVVSQVSSDQAAMSLLSVLESALSDPFMIDGNEVRIGLSIGVALFPDDGASADQLCSAADRSMYVSKRSGREHRLGITMPHART